MGLPHYFKIIVSFSIEALSYLKNMTTIPVVDDNPKVRFLLWRVLVPFLFVYTALYAAWTVFHWGGPEVTARIAGSPLVLPCLIAAALAFWRARNEMQPSARRGWSLLAFALTVYGIGLVIWAYYTVETASIPFPSVADPLFLVFPWIFFASLMALTHDQLSTLDRRRVLLNTAVMVGAVGLIEWVVLLHDTVAVDAASLVTSVVALLYPLGDLVMVGGLLFSTLLLLNRMHQPFLLFLVGGASLFVVGNFVYAIQIANGTYRAGSPLDLTWSLGFVFFSVAMLLLSQPLPMPNPVQGISPWSKRAQGVVLGSLSLGALAVLIWMVLHRQDRLDSSVRDAVVTGVALLLIGSATALRQRLELRENTLLNRDLQDVNASLEARVKDAVDGLERRNHELEVQTQEVRSSNEEIRERTHDITLLNELGDLLQMCVSFEEASSVIARMGPHFFPNTAGALYLISASRNLVERAAGWGNHDRTEVFIPEECWALRRGREHLVTQDGIAPRCAHLTDGSAGTYLCIPLVAQGEALGLLHLNTASSEATWQSGAGQRLARTVADAIGLALSNIRLRETLLYQSIRDPLTGLFNRRYLEETLERELSRAARNNSSIGVIVFDVDHFKRFNDTFGHEAGDLVLKEFGPLVREHHRHEDIACRYGGEEFVLVLPGADLEVTRQRAEALRESAKRLQLSIREQSLGNVSLSLGVAVYPGSGLSADSLIRAADAALYRAKHEGRDRVVIAQENQVLEN